MITDYILHIHISITLLIINISMCNGNVHMYLNIVHLTFIDLKLTNGEFVNAYKIYIHYTHTLLEVKILHL